jgi:hypothetical protein
VAGLAGVAAAMAVAVGALVVSVSITRSDVGENIARRTADVYHALPAAQRDRTVIVGESYIVAAFLDGVAPKYQLPTSYSTNRSYGYYPAATRRPRRGALRRT